ncbi:uncharacterized protein [Panulirus ornatus]|uniref:uncharacterized protein isoform X2 n=1 Tax=Panulirus ornatus TaxID=150431 RepID=UPI003A8BF855
MVGGGWLVAVVLAHTALSLSREESKVFLLQAGVYDQPSTEVFVRYNFSSGPALSPLEDLTVCYRVWITKYRSSISPFVSYAYSDEADNALLFFQAKDDLAFYYNDKKESSDLLLKADDTLEIWHHHCFVFTHPSYRVYVDGVLIQDGVLVSQAAPIPLNGTLYLGQEQDKFDGGLDAHQSFSGYITQVNIWDYEVKPSVIWSIANCLDNARGNVLSTDATPVEESKVGTQTVHMSAFCKSREKFVIIPVKMFPSDADSFCRLADSRFFIPADEEANSNLYNASRQFAEACAGKSYRFIFLGAKDDVMEGQWTRIADGQPLHYTAWSPGEPNGGNKRNCLVLRKYDDRWGDVQCEDKLCFSCGRSNLDYLQLRGLCQKEEHQTRFLLDGYINGWPFFRGYYGMLIYHSGVSEWMLQDTNGNITMAILSMVDPTGFPIGRRAWRVVTSFCGYLEESQVVLGLSTCTTQEFMCTDGSCVPRSVRCNLRDDCLDGSDEENCSIVFFSDRYHNHRPPPGATFDTPLQIEPSVDLIRFSKIDDIDLAFHIEIEIALSWTDRNLRFKNIKNEEGKNKLSEQEVEKVWTPEVEFLNVNDGQLKLLKSGMYVRQTGEPDPPIFTDVQMDTIYQPKSGRLVQRRQYYASFSCNFGLFKYPFDTQTCFIFIKLASADTNVLSLKNASVVHRGNSQLPKYSLQNIKIFIKSRSGYGVLEVRAIMTLTTLLVLYTLFNQVSSALPNTAYIKMIDQWFFFCIFLIFSIIVIHITVENLEKEGDAHKTRTVKVSPMDGRKVPLKPSLFTFTVSAEKVLLVCRRLVYPLIILIFCLIFWIVILSVS